MAGSKIALIIGAGFSSEAGLPSTAKIGKNFLESPLNGELHEEIETEISTQLTNFWRYAFHYEEQNESPSLEDHFTLLDLAANTGRNIGPNYPPKKLRAIRRWSIHRVFQILDKKYHHSEAIEKLLNSLQRKSGLAIVSTNWDIVVENHLRKLRVPYSYGAAAENLQGAELTTEGIPLLTLHGSANWIYCDSCRRLYASEENDGKAALKAQIYIHTDDFRELCEENGAVIHLLSESPRHAKKCIHCGNRLGARIATFSYRKEVSIPQFQTVWQQAFSTLRDSDTWIFIGYSMPEADFEFRHLLKSAEKAVAGEKRKEIQVILKDDGPAAVRFMRFFGITETNIYQRGLCEYVKEHLS